MMLCSPQHEGRPTHDSQKSAPETEIDDYADTKPHFKKPISPTELMERNARRTLSPDGTS
jgi:hypothetical protein